MADSTTNIAQMTSGQGSKEVTVNENFDAGSPSMLFGRNALTVTGLTWGFLGGRIYIDGVATAIANGTVALTLSATNYVEVSIAGTVTANTTGFSADKAPLYKVVTGASTITSYEDHRNPMTLRRLFYGRTTIAMADANKTLTHAQAACDSIECTGANTALRDLIVPTVKRPYTVYANTTGGFGVQVKTSAGTGITVADGTRVTLECDGINVVSVGAAASGLTNPMTTSGDIIYGGTAGAATRLAKGSDTQVLTLVSGLPSWVAPSSGGMTNPMTAGGDIIIGGTAGSPVALHAGSNGHVLTLASGSPAWVPATGGGGIFTVPESYSAVGDGTTSDNTAITNTITQAKSNGGFIGLAGAAKRYLVTALSNVRGVKIMGDGAIVKSITGGLQQLNSEGDLYQYIAGREYMAAFHNVLIAQSSTPTRQLKVIFSGDSTTVGDGASSPYLIHELFKTLSEKTGLQTAYGVNSINSGHGGKNTAQWNRDYVATDVAAAPDMYVLRWGVNDPGAYSANMDAGPALDAGQSAAGRRTADDFITSLRAGLATARASKTVAQMTIVLMTPNSTSDTPNARDELWYESIIPGIRQAARDYQCVFLDTYNYLRDSRGAAGVWMDDVMTSPSGRAIHPLNVMNIWIANLLAEVAFPRAMKAAVGVAEFVNIGGAQTLRNHTDLPATYPYGMSIYRAFNSNGWPLNGNVITWRSKDETLYQLLYPFSTADAGKTQWRIGRSANLGTGATTLVWEAWNSPGAETKADATPGTGFVQPGTSGNMRGTKNGNVTLIEGYITKSTPAVIASGTTVATLPAGYRPVTDALYGTFVTAWDGTNFTAIMARIQPDGAVVTLAATVGSTQRIYVTVGFSTLV